MNFLDRMHKISKPEEHVIYSSSLDNKFFSRRNNILIGVDYENSQLISLQINTDEDHNTAQFILYLHEIDLCQCIAQQSCV